ncbi:hypothetical protein FoTM2_003995 [Fusarium oxysporum f. sp. vasinfectum]|nr:hypothetical protein FoTM2_003995 [Fusarium oxysporum f. sp. vasinfectum]
MRPFTPATRNFSGPVPRSSTPVRSILKPASVLGRRKAEYAGLSDPVDAPESPTKRRKIFIDETRNVTYEVGRRTMDEVKLEVRTALEEHLRGNDSQYDTLKELFASDKQRYLPPVVGEEDDTLKPHELQVYVVALTGCVPILKNRLCNGLVHTVLNCSWLGRDDAFVKVFTHFLAALVSAQGSYLSPVLMMMVGKFSDSRSSVWSVPDFPEVSRETMRNRLHSTLHYLLQMFPSAISVLEELLVSKLPFHNESMRVHMAYVDNLLRIKDYVPDSRDEVFDIILKRVVQIDSQMQTDLEDLDDDVTAAVMYALREHSEGDDDDPDFDENVARIKSIKGSVEKMDAMMDTLFSVYTPHFTNPGSDTAFDMFTVLLREFEQLVLPTYKSRHTQFLIFHFAQMHERLTDAFCGQLIATAFQGNTPNVLKQSAAAYLASFVARGAHLPSGLIRSIFGLLLHHLDQYRKKYEPLCRGPDLMRFTPYYSLVQATLYIFCFRWQDLIVSTPEFVDPEDPASYIGQEMEWMGTCRKDLSVQIFSKLNPLKVCAPVIVEEFAKISHRLNFMYVYPLVESNKRVRLTQYLTATYSTGGALRDAGYETQDESFHQLDPYFPFDPYQLPVTPENSSETSPQKSRKSLTATEKAKLRRTQVRRAQIQHRQRKAEYQKQLELDITHFRELIALTEFESEQLKKDNDSIKELLTNKGITIPRCKSGTCSIRPRLTKDVVTGDNDAWVDDTLGVKLRAEDPSFQEYDQDGGEIFADINVDDIIVTLKKDESMETPAFSIRSNESSSNATSSPPPLPDLNLTPEEEQKAVNFILSLEHICWDHFFVGDFPSHSHLSNDEPKGHCLMASSLCMANAPLDVFGDRKLVSSASSCHNRRSLGLDPYVPPVHLEWPSPRISLSSLYGLAQSLNPGDLEITPVQAWFELASRFDKSLLLERLDLLGTELVGVSKCLEFGAVMEKDAFESVVARVYGGTLEEAMAAAAIIDPHMGSVCDISRMRNFQANLLTNQLGFVGYAQS